MFSFVENERARVVKLIRKWEQFLLCQFYERYEIW